MSTDIVPSSEMTISDQMQFAKVAADGDMLPQAYRGKPANVLIAVGLGQAMGLSPAEALYRIDVIQGKPTASAELIAANVRRAGHRLRIRVDEKAVSASATILRADDPDYEHTVIRDMAWAKQMGLATKDNYKKQPTTMLQWRAISAVARQACPEALYGVVYTGDEVQDTQPPAPSQPSERSATATIRSLVSEEPVREDTESPLVDELTENGDVMTDKTRGHLFALFTQKGADTREKQLKGIAAYAGVEVESRGDLTEAQAQQVIDGLRRLADVEPAQEPLGQE